MYSNGKKPAIASVEISGFAIRSLISGSGVLKLKTTVKTAFILATVIDKEFGKTEINILTFGAANTWICNTLFGHNSSKSTGSRLFLANLRFSSYHYG